MYHMKCTGNMHGLGACTVRAPGLGWACKHRARILLDLVWIFLPGFRSNELNSDIFSQHIIQFLSVT